MSSRFPTGSGVLKGFGKGVGFGAGEAAMAIVKQYRDRTAKRFGGKYQVEAAIAVDVAGDNFQPAGERENRDKLATSAA
jgi:hypothetical protein